MHFWFGLAALVSAPLAAQSITPMPPPAADFAAMQTEDLANRFDALSEDADICSHAFPIMRELADRRPDLPDIVTEARRFELLCAYERDDFETAFRILDTNPAVAASVNEVFALYITSRGGDGTALPAAFESLFRSKGETLKTLSPEVVGLALRRTRETGGVEKLDELVRTFLQRQDLDNTLDPDVRQILSLRALNAAARAGDVEGSRALLAVISDPASFEALLGQRTYERIWPAVEERVGAVYTRITPAFLAAKLKAFEADPKAEDALNDLTHALYYDGQFAELVAFADKETARSDLLATMTESEGWALNLKAYALDALGRPREADAVFDLLAKAATQHKSWGVSMIINRASRLVGQKRWAEGLSAAGEAKTIAAEFGTDYAHGLIAQAEACALFGLGRVEEAKATLVKLEAKSLQLPGIYAEALLCVGRADEASDILIAAIANPTTRDSVLSDLQPAAMELFYTKRLLPQPRDLLNTHPRLRETFLAQAREVPRAYWPAASLKR